MTNNGWYAIKPNPNHEGILLESKWGNHTVVLTWLLQGQISILFYQRDKISIKRSNVKLI